MIKKLIVLLLLLFLVGGAVTTPAVTAAAVPTLPTTALTSDATPTPQLDYRVSLAPSQIFDGTIEYFKSQGFTTVVLVAAEPVSYQKELQKIEQLGMYPILDIENVIWNEGANKSTPITAYESDFSMWKQAGWWNVATEGGRSGDLDVLKDYFPKITYLNCDECGLYQDNYRSPDVTEMSWETYYPSEISSIQSGALISYNLGKPQGITAGVWAQNNVNLNYDTYKSLLDWSYANGVGFTHFNVFFGLGATIADYHRLGFDAIISQLQQAYPPRPIGNWPEITVTSVRQVPSPQNSIVWDVTNLGNQEAWVAPYAILHNASATLPCQLNASAILSQSGSNNSSASVVLNNDSLGWVQLAGGESVSILSQPAVPTGTSGAAYNVYVYYGNASQGWLYNQPLYTAVGAKPIPTNFLGLFDYSNTDVVLLLLVVLLPLLLIVLVPLFRRKRQK